MRRSVRRGARALPVDSAIMDAAAPLGNVITLGAIDFARLRRFYGALGWPTVVDDDDFVAFELRGAVLAIFPVEKLATDGHATADRTRAGIRSSIAVMAERPDDVDDLVKRMRDAGARVTKAPQDAEFFEGRDAYLADPEENYWEIAWAPATNAIFAAARRAAGAPALPSLAGHRNILLETRKRDGSWVGTAVNPVVEDDHLFFRTWDRSGKAKRLRNFSEVRFAASTARGVPTGAALIGHATLLEGERARHAASLINRRYPLLQGVGVRLFHRLMRYRTLHYVVADIRPSA